MPKPPAIREATAPEPRKGMPSVELDEAEFRRRFLSQFSDPAFDGRLENPGGELESPRQK